MKFNELRQIFKKKFGIDKLADIARELEVSPQVINNWKAKNQVPYKYVRLAKEKIKDDLISKTNPLSTYAFFGNPEPNEKEDLMHHLIDFLSIIYSAIKKDFKIFFGLPLLAVLMAYLHLKSVDSLYTSKMKILPLGSGGVGGGAIGLAAQLGFDLGAKQSSELFSAELYPEILSSRNFMRRLLGLQFIRNSNSTKSEELLEILKNKPKPSNGWHANDIRGGINILLRDVVNVKKPRKSPVISISITTNDSKLSKDIGDSIISQLRLAFFEYKNKKVNDRIFFIKNRLSEIDSNLVEAEETLKNFREKNRSILDSPTLLLNLERLNREVSLQNQIYLSLSSELEIEQINQHGIEKSFEVLDPPENMGRTYPKPKFIAAIYLFASILLSGLIIFIKINLNNFRNYPK